MQEEHKEPSPEEWYKRTVRLIAETKRIDALGAATPDAFEGAKR
jgi:hypothetical protein